MKPSVCYAKNKMKVIGSLEFQTPATHKAILWPDLRPGAYELSKDIRNFAVLIMMYKRSVIFRFVFLGLFLATTATVMAQTKPARLAIGPFFAPADNPTLVTAANAMPDLLTASLSQDPRFQLVERQQVNAIWSEMHLTEAGLTSADTVMKLGKMLSCDLLISGTFAQTPDGPLIWIKVINPQTSLLQDLQSFPAAGTNADATTAAISQFIIQAGSRSTPREFIAVGKFEDQTTAPGKEDWAPKIVAMVEKHFMAMGYGVAERDAVNPIFSEYQFQAEGMTGNDPNRVKLAPAFWMIDGGCKWIQTTGDKLSVVIRFRRAGTPEQLFSFSKPGDAVEEALVETIQSALTNAGSITAIEARQFEEKTVSAHADELFHGRGETVPIHYDTNVTYVTVTAPDGSQQKLAQDPLARAMQEQHVDESIKTLEQAILLNPKDMKSKWFLGLAWFHVPDGGESKRGEDLLEEVAASGDPVYATKAKNWLSDIRSGKIEIVREPVPHMVFHGQPASFPPPPPAPPAIPATPTDESKISGEAVVLSAQTLAIFADDKSGLFEPDQVLVQGQTFMSITAPGVRQQLELNRQQVFASLPSQPNDMDKRWSLGLAWYLSQNPENHQKGTTLLQQVASGNNVFLALKAKAWLADFQDGHLSLAAGANGECQVLARGLPRVLNQSSYAEGADGPVASLAPNVGKLAGMENNTYWDGQTRAYKNFQDEYIFTVGKNLIIVNARTLALRSEAIPTVLDDDISAVDGDTASLWLGCGHSIVQLDLADGSTRKFGAEAGLPGDAVTALCHVGDKLYVGLSSGRAGSFGCLDLATGKFNDYPSGAVLNQDWATAMRQPPATPVSGIFVKDDQHLLVLSGRGVQLLDLPANQWTATAYDGKHQAFVDDGKQMAISRNFIAMPGAGKNGVMLCRLPGTNWVQLDLFNYPTASAVICLATDPVNPDYLWVGDIEGDITLLDTANSRILVHDALRQPAILEEDIYAICPGTKYVSVVSLPTTDHPAYNLRKFDRESTIPGYTAPAGSSGAPGITITAELGRHEDEFLKRNFSWFQKMEFTPPVNGDAAMQHVNTKGKMLQYGNSYYSGVRFTVPAWDDGTLFVMRTMNKTEAEKDLFLRADSGLISAAGKPSRPNDARHWNLDDYPDLRRQFPYTASISRESFSDSLDGGQDYVYWMRFENATAPNMVFWVTVDSIRGSQEIGNLPIQPPY